MKKIIIVITMLLTAAVMLAGCDLFIGARDLYYEDASGDTAVTNSSAPEIADSREKSIANFTGDVVVINFWATWCPPCRSEIPDFVEVYAEYRDKGVLIVGVTDEEASVIEGFTADYGIEYPILLDRTGMFSDWGIEYIPTTFILDSNRNVVFQKVGPMTKDELISEIENAN